MSSIKLFRTSSNLEAETFQSQVAIDMVGDIRFALLIILEVVHYFMSNFILVCSPARASVRPKV